MLILNSGKWTGDGALSNIKAGEQRIEQERAVRGAMQDRLVASTMWESLGLLPAEADKQTGEANNLPIGKNEGEELLPPRPGAIVDIPDSLKGTPIRTIRTSTSGQMQTGRHGRN
jgi:hypothetical protein